MDLVSCRQLYDSVVRIERVRRMSIARGRHQTIADPAQGARNRGCDHVAHSA
jgi:hypothetical protein